MRAAVTAVLVSALALGVAACDPKKKEEAPAAPGETPSAQTPATPPAAPTGANGLPRRKPGLWESAISVKGEDRATTTQICLDAATEARQSIWGGEMSREMCQKYETHRGLDGSFSFSSTCNLGSGGVTRSEGHATGDLTSNYVIKMKSSTSGAELEMMNRDQEFTITARRVGECKPGQRGGDMIMNGRVVANMNDMPGMGKK